MESYILNNIIMIISSLMTGAGQPVTHMRSANSKPQPSNQFPMDKIKPRPNFSCSRSRFTRE